LVKVCGELGYPVFPEVGQSEENCTTRVIEFPVKAPTGRIKRDVSAIEQLEIYKMFMEHYVDHNCSITIHVRDEEWDAVEEWVFEHWDDTVALSFLSFEDSFYELLPYEEISREEYERRAAAMKPFIPSLISKYEKEEIEYDLGNEGCETGVCPIR
ncbi:MAG: ribonucleoside-triphosphate reductase, adenosylcobalamin-dependent, partial [Clostridiales Family XIII bacterium]|nr:ribonucleoside-triphosphate reductase, adenosylcobalamin-dependent [Clostridiales Family XIII bacterium]